MVNLFNWFLGLTETFARFMTWLTTNLPYLNMSPLELLTFNGITLVLAFVILRLIIGG